MNRDFEMNAQLFSSQSGLPGVDAVELIPLASVAEIYGVDPRTVQLWAEKKWIPRGSNGLYDIKAVIRGVYEAQRGLINKKKGSEGEALEDLDLRERKAKTEKAELELRRLKGELLEKDRVEKREFELGREVRDAVENVPNRVAALLAAEGDQHKVRKILLDELKKALEIMRNGSSAS